MKIEKNNHYFNIALYVFLTCIAIIITTTFILNIKVVWGFICTIVGIIYMLLEPLIIGIVIAYLLDPIATFYDKKWQLNLKIKWFHTHKQPHFNQKEKRWHTRTMPTLLTFLTLLSIIGLFILLIKMNIEQVSNSFSMITLKDSIRYYLAYFEEMITGMTKLIDQLGLINNSVGLIERLYSIVNQLVINLYNKLTTSLSDIALHAMNWLLALVIAFYLLQDKSRCLALSNHLFSHLLKKNNYQSVKSFAKDVDSVFTGYIRGEVIDSIIMTILTSISLMIVGLDFAIIVGIISGIFNLIPYFGPIVGFLLTIIIGLLDPNPMKAVYGAIAIIIIQQIDGWIIVPQIVGDCVKLHPIIVLLAILIGGNLFGLIGMLLAVPFAALIRLLLIRLMPDLFSD